MSLTFDKRFPVYLPHEKWDSVQPVFEFRGPNEQCATFVRRRASV